MVQIFADSNRARMRYIKESDSAWGQTPNSGVTRELRYTGSTLNAQKDTAVSEEIRADRMVPSYIETGAHSSGELNVEFSAGSHDDFMEGFAYGAWTRPMTFDYAKGISVSWGSTSKVYISGIDLSLYFTAGHRIRTNGFVNPNNNSYWSISAITFNSGANRTEITTTETLATVEAGTAYTEVGDANDVIILKDTHIRSGTTGASAFDSNGNNSFAAAIAAGQLLSGQKIYVEGLGYETGTVTFADPASSLVAAGATITLNDGVNDAVTFQFGGSPVAGNVMVVASTTDDTITATNFAAAVNAQRPSGTLAFKAVAAAAVVTLTNLNGTGATDSKAGDTNTAITLGAFSGGHADAHGIYTIVSAVDDTLTVNPAPPTLANTTLKVTIKGSMLRNPAIAADIVPHSFSFETGFEDVSEFFTADGQRIGTWAYNVSAGAILTGSFGLQGRGMARAVTTKLGDSGSYTVLDTTATPVANATTNVGKIYKNGSQLSTALKTISFNGNNNLRDQMAVGNKFPVGIGAGRIEFTGNVEAYFSDGDLWENFINHDFVSLNFYIQDVSSNHYEFTFPNVCFSTDTVNPAGGNQDVMENMEWMAMRDPITDCMFQVDRFSALVPLLG